MFVGSVMMFPLSFLILVIHVLSQFCPDQLGNRVLNFVYLTKKKKKTSFGVSKISLLIFSFLFYWFLFHFVCSPSFYFLCLSCLTFPRISKISIYFHNSLNFAFVSLMLICFSLLLIFYHSNIFYLFVSFAKSPVNLTTIILMIDSPFLFSIFFCVWILEILLCMFFLFILPGVCSNYLIHGLKLFLLLKILRHFVFKYCFCSLSFSSHTEIEYMLHLYIVYLMYYHNVIYLFHSCALFWIFISHLSSTSLILSSVASNFSLTLSFSCYFVTCVLFFFNSKISILILFVVLTSLKNS